MPTALPHPCAVRNCPGLTRDRFCNAHARAYNRTRDTHYSSRAWRRTRARALSLAPVCSCGNEATEVHHIVARADGGADEPGNLVTMCKRCHSAMTAKGGRWG